MMARIRNLLWQFSKNVDCIHFLLCTGGFILRPLITSRTCGSPKMAVKWMTGLSTAFSIMWKRLCSSCGRSSQTSESTLTHVYGMRKRNETLPLETSFTLTSLEWMFENLLIRRWKILFKPLIARGGNSSDSPCRVIHIAQQTLEPTSFASIPGIQT